MVLLGMDEKEGLKQQVRFAGFKRMFAAGTDKSQFSQHQVVDHFRIPFLANLFMHEP